MAASRSIVMDGVAQPSVVIRPSAANAGGVPAVERAWLLAGAALMLCGVGLAGGCALASLDLPWEVLVAAFVLGLALVLVPIVRRRVGRSTVVFANGESFGMTTVKGKRRVFPTSDLAGVVLCTVISPGNHGDRTACAFFMSTSGQCLFRLQSRQWGREDLARLCEVAGVPLVGSWDQTCLAGYNPLLAASLPRLKR